MSVLTTQSKEEHELDGDSAPYRCKRCGLKLLSETAAGIVPCHPRDPDNPLEAPNADEIEFTRAGDL